MREVSALSGVLMMLSTSLLALHVYSPSCDLLVVDVIVRIDILISCPVLFVMVYSSNSSEGSVAADRASEELLKNHKMDGRGMENTEQLKEAGSD